MDCGADSGQQGGYAGQEPPGCQAVALPCCLPAATAHLARKQPAGSQWPGMRLRCLRAIRAAGGQWAGRLPATTCWHVHAQRRAPAAVPGPGALQRTPIPSHSSTSANPRPVPLTAGRALAQAGDELRRSGKGVWLPTSSALARRAAALQAGGRGGPRKSASVAGAELLVSATGREGHGGAEAAGQAIHRRCGQESGARVGLDCYRSGPVGWQYIVLDCTCTSTRQELTLPCPTCAPCARPPSMSRCWACWTGPSAPSAASEGLSRSNKRPVASGLRGDSAMLICTGHVERGARAASRGLMAEESACRQADLWALKGRCACHHTGTLRHTPHFPGSPGRPPPWAATEGRPVPRRGRSGSAASWRWRARRLRRPGGPAGARLPLEARRAARARRGGWAGWVGWFGEGRGDSG